MSINNHDACWDELRSARNLRPDYSEALSWVWLSGGTERPRALIREARVVGFSPRCSTRLLQPGGKTMDQIAYENSQQPENSAGALVRFESAVIRRRRRQAMTFHSLTGGGLIARRSSRGARRVRFVALW